jgi:hypothetical protein
MLATWLLLATATCVVADDLAVETLLSGLQNPAGVAIRPDASADNYEIFVSDTKAGRIVRVQSTKSESSEDAIIGFASKPDVDEPFQSPGPHGLLFLDRLRLVVTGRHSNGRGFVRLYELPDEDKPLVAEQHEQQIESAADGEQPGARVVSFHGLARTQSNDLVPDLLLLTALGNEGAGTTWKLPVRAGTLGELELFGSTAPRGSLRVPSAVAVGPRGYIVTSEPDANESRASRLKFINPIDGRVALQVTVKLPDLVGLAYSPRSGNLYAINFASRDPQRGGVYRIDAGEPGQASAVKVAEVRQPRALAFDPDGALYVTAMDDADDIESNRGVLLKLTGAI